MSTEENSPEWTPLTAEQTARLEKNEGKPLPSDVEPDPYLAGISTHHGLGVPAPILLVSRNYPGLWVRMSETTLEKFGPPLDKNGDPFERAKS